MTVELGPHQLKAIGEMKNGCIVKGGVGTGKSRTAIGYYFQNVCQGTLQINGHGEMGDMRTPKDIYIITTAKKRDDKDWEKECAPFMIANKREISFGGTQLHVDSWNNITKYEGVKDAFFIFDEQRLVGSGAWVKAFLRIARDNEWIVLSATPGDVWLDYVPVFLAHGFFRNRTEFINQHCVYSRYSKFPKIERYTDTARLDALRRRIVVDMPYDRHTVRHEHFIHVPYDQAAFERVTKDRWHIYEDRPIRDIGEMFLVMRKLANSDPSRLAAIKELVVKHPRLIIFYNFNFELEALRTLSEITTVAEWNGHKHEPVPEGDSWVYLVQYTAGAEGWNCVRTDATAFYSLNYSYKVFEQSKGRIDRLNTKYTDLHYYILASNSMIDKAILKSLKEKRNFNEKDLIRSVEPEQTKVYKQAA